MILRITEGTSDIALRVHELMYNEQRIDWEQLELVVMPGEKNRFGHPCGPNGSPWYLEGCWPGKLVGVDVANIRRDFTPMSFDAYKLDDEGRIVFHLDEKFHSLRPGRYTGFLRVKPPEDYVYQLPILMSPGANDKRIPAIYAQGALGCADLPDGESDPCKYIEPPRYPACVIATFDIDIAHMCANNMIQEVALEFTKGDAYEA